MGTRGIAGSLLAATALAAGALAAPAAAEPAGFSVRSYMVPVTQPDELGRPVSLDTDVYLPAGRPPRRGWPLIEIFHGGGSDKSNPYDTGYAKEFASHGYASLIYSARGHGDSGGQTTVIGPKEIRDLYDVTAWALGIGGRDAPPHPSFHIDRRRIGLAGYSQGGLHTNLAQAYMGSPRLNPYGIRFAAFAPGNTPDYTFRALAPHGVIKLSVGVGLLETYLVGTSARVSPLIAKWVAQLAPDQPVLWGGRLCDTSPHDTPASPVRNDLAVRSPGCFSGRLRGPVEWSQSFDDAVFPPDMAIHELRRLSNPADRLYLTMGGHAAPAAPASAEADKLHAELRFFRLELKGRGRALPPVTYWTRDPAVAVPEGAYAYPEGSWAKHTAPTWPPPGTRRARWELGADGRAVGSGAKPGSLPLAPLASDVTDDPVVSAAMSATPIGTSPVPSALPRLSAPGLVAGFATAPFRSERELDGQPRIRIPWTPLSPDTQLVLMVYDRAPDGALTLLSRGVLGIRGAEPGTERVVRVAGNAMSAAIHPGHSLVAMIAASSPSFYLPYAPSLGGVAAAGPGASLSVPLGR